jgi:Ni/Fe-hydrogenase subunit HybB-like protein
MILSVTCALLLERMIYSTITILTNSSQPEGLWYPLDALPEWLVACLICSPGLVLSRDELEEKDLELDGYRNRPLIPPTVV